MKRRLNREAMTKSQLDDKYARSPDKKRVKNLRNHSAGRFLDFKADFLFHGAVVFTAICTAKAIINSVNRINTQRKIFWFLFIVDA